MPSDLTPSSAVENTPAMNMPEAPPSAPESVLPVVPDVAPSVTEARIAELLSDMEKRVTQSNKDTIKSAVNKALGIPKPSSTPDEPTSTPQEVPEVDSAPAAPASPSSSPATPGTPPDSSNVEESVTPTVPSDPVWQKAFDLLQADGVDPNSADPVVLEAYRTQAEAGVHLTGDMPEFAQIDSSSITAYLVSVANATSEAKARMIEEGTYQEAPDTEADAPALIPGLVKGSAPNRPKHIGKSGAETLDMFFNGRQ